MFVDQGGKRASGRVRFELLPQLCDRCDKLTLVSNNHFLIEQPGAQERGHQKIGNCVLIMQDECVSSEQDLGIMFNEGMSYRSTAMLTQAAWHPGFLNWFVLDQDKIVL